MSTRGPLEKQKLSFEKFKQIFGHENSNPEEQYKTIKIGDQVMHVDLNNYTYVKVKEEKQTNNTLTK